MCTLECPCCIDLWEVLNAGKDASNDSQCFCPALQVTWEGSNDDNRDNEGEEQVDHACRHHQNGGRIAGLVFEPALVAMGMRVTVRANVIFTREEKNEHDHAVKASV